jgi:coproporphyrinogen III oxidase
MQSISTQPSHPSVPPTNTLASRGIGGLFFDDLSTPPDKVEEKEKLFGWVKSCGEGFVESYLPIVHRRKNADFTERMKQWQQLRRVGPLCQEMFSSKTLMTNVGAICGIQSCL